MFSTKKFLIFLLCLCASSWALAGLFGQQSTFLPADQAFQFREQQQNNQLQLHWQIADGYWLYQKEITIDAPDVQMGSIQFPQAKLHQDAIFGETNIYQNQLSITIPIEKFKPNATVTINYQGCTEGLCYPPESKVIDRKSVV